MVNLLKLFVPLNYEIIQSPITVDKINDDGAFHPICDDRLDIVATILYSELNFIKKEGQLCSIADLAIKFDTPLRFIENGIKRIEKLGYLRIK